MTDKARWPEGTNEGLEPNVTEELITLMISANGGKIQHTR